MAVSKFWSGACGDKVHEGGLDSLRLLLTLKSQNCQIRNNILDFTGLGNCWNEGKGIGGMVGTVSRLAFVKLESQGA